MNNILVNIARIYQRQKIIKEIKLDLYLLKYYSYYYKIYYNTTYLQSILNNGILSKINHFVPNYNRLNQSNKKYIEDIIKQYERGIIKGGCNKVMKYKIKKLTN